MSRVVGSYACLPEMDARPRRVAMTLQERCQRETANKRRMYLKALRMNCETHRSSGLSTAVAERVAIDEKRI